MSESSKLLSGQTEVSKAYGTNLVKSIAKVGKPTETQSPADRMQWLKPLAFSVLFIFVGVAYFMARLGWSFSKALYFCVVTITTVGYGDFYPIDSASKLFIVAYVICAISAIATYLSGVVEGVIEKQAEHLTNVLSRQFDVEQGKEEPEEGIFTEAFQSLAFFTLIFVIGVGFFVFGQKQSLVDALYLTTISSSTVGYGDLTIEHTARAELFTSVWLVFSTIGLAKVGHPLRLQSSERASSENKP
uniref:Potassium channel domain-containing protein n=1 Tax=Rhodosorus marinus TaxID=101924 RepID=A0A7S0BP44_9RHOD|mmetsp:Transcript_25051/g.36118  ORF Transcript_25051/g.36118 Transcript_25051/m.36118 type:complete len:245 (+) Transcript_25051:63-797(+)